MELSRILEQSECFGVFGRTKALPVKELQLLKVEKIPADLLEDSLVGAGFAADPMMLRLIRHTRGKTTSESLTKALAASCSSAGEVAELYLSRWSVERLFFDLQVVLNLQRFHAASPGAVAMRARLSP